MGATGLGRTGFAHIAGLHKGEESQAATGGEEGSLESAPGVVAGGRGQQAQAGSWGGGGVTLSGDLGRAVEACSPKWISQQLHGTDAAGGSSQGDLGAALLGPGSGITWSPWPGCRGAWNCRAVSDFKVMTNPGSFLPGGITRLGPQAHSVPACVCALLRARVGVKPQGHTPSLSHLTPQRLAGHLARAGHS